MGKDDSFMFGMLTFFLKDQNTFKHESESVGAGRMRTARDHRPVPLAAQRVAVALRFHPIVLGFVA